MSKQSVSSMKKIISVLSILVIFGLAIVYFITREDTAPSVDIGSPAPNFELARLGADSLSLDELKGNVVLVNFWATWCGPCRDEMPDMQRVYDRYHNEGFEIVAVNLEESEVTVQGFVNKLNLTYPIVYDLTGEVFDMYLVRPLPTSYFIDREGIIRFVFVGPMDEETIERRVKLLLDDSPKEAT